MTKSKNTVSYTAPEIELMRRKGGDRSDEAKLAKSEADAEDKEFDWARAVKGIPAPKQRFRRDGAA